MLTVLHCKNNGRIFWLSYYIPWSLQIPKHIYKMTFSESIVLILVVKIANKNIQYDCKSSLAGWEYIILEYSVNFQNDFVDTKTTKEISDKTLISDNKMSKKNCRICSLSFTWCNHSLSIIMVYQSHVRRLADYW